MKWIKKQLSDFVEKNARKNKDIFISSIVAVLLIVMIVFEVLVHFTGQNITIVVLHVTLSIFISLTVGIVIYFFIRKNRKEEMKYQLLADNLHDVVTVFDMDLKITYVSPSIFGFCGFTPEEAMTQTLEQMLTAESMASVTTIFTEELALEAIGTADPKRIRIITLKEKCKDGSEIWAEVTVSFLRNQNQTPIGIITVSRDITDRKQAEFELIKAKNKSEKSEKRFRTFIGQSPVAIALFSLDGTGMYANQKFLEILGLKSPGAFIGKPAHDYFAPQFREESKERSRRRLMGLPVPAEFESVALRSDGLEFPVQVAVGTINLSEDETVSIGFLIDITKRRQAENALQNIEAKQRAMISNISDVIGIINSDGFIIYKSPNIKKYFGWEPNDLIGTDGWLTVHPDDLKRIQNEFYILLEKDNSSTIIEYRYKCKDGNYKLIELTATNLTNDLIINGVLLNYHDITERKQTEERLRSSEDFFSQMFIQSKTSTQIFDPDGNCIRVNPQFCNLFGVKEEEIINGYNVFKDQAVIDSSVLHLVKEIFVDKKVNKWELNFDIALASKSTKTPSVRREKFWIDVLGYPILDKDESLLYVVLQHYDITERKEAEKVRGEFETQTRQVQRLESIGVLAGGIAHDFNNLLGVLMGNISLAQGNESSSEREKYLAEAMQAIKRASGLAQQLLAFAKGGIPSKKLASVSEIIQESVDLSLGKSSPVKYKLNLAENLWMAEVDAGQIGQAIRNLIINANQAMPEGGTIQIWAKNEEVLSDNSFGLESGDFVYIIIKDSGGGIPEKFIDKIFDPYFTTKNNGGGGSGLGLAITHSVIQKHAGYIKVNSKQNKGTTFHIYLPATKEKLAEIKIEKDVSMSAIGLKILMMDDERAIRKMVEAMLKRLGHKIELAEHGEKAIEKFVTARNSGKPFDLVFLDLTIPGGMGGVETFGKLLEIDPDVKAIVSSGYSGTVPEGFISVLPKPYSMSAMKETINEIFS